MHKNIKVLILIFILTFIGYSANTYMDYNRNLKFVRMRRLLPSQDVIPNTFLPYTILKDKTFDLTKVNEKVENEPKPYYLVRIKDKQYSVYPVPTALMAIPIYLPAILSNKIPNLDTHLNILKVLLLGRVAAIFYASLSVVLFYMIIDKFSDKKDKVWKILFTLFYAFGTTTYSISSRGLWMHTTSQFIISLIILLLFSKSKKPMLLGALLGLAVITRPTNIVIAGVFGIYTLFNYSKKEIINFILGTIPFVIFMFGYNYLTFGSPFMEGYAARNDHNWNVPLLTSIPAFLYSPARSFLFISPPLVLSYFAIVKIFLSKDTKILKYLSITFILGFLMISKWWAWQGANGFGYRMLTEYLPIVGLLSYLVSKNFNKLGKGIMLVLMVFSIYVHTNAVIFRKSRCDAQYLWSMYCLMPPKEWPQY